MTAQPTHIETNWSDAARAQWLHVRVLAVLEAWARDETPTCAHRVKVTLGPPDVTIVDLSDSATRCMDCTMDALANVPGDWVDGRLCDVCGERDALVTTFAAADTAPAIILLVALCESCVRTAAS